MSSTKLTTTAGAPVPDNQNSVTAGARGPVLMQDYQLLEKLAHQNRERIPERVVHAKGWGAFGTLKITGDISKYTKAKALQPGTETPMLLRVSTVAGELGAADAERDVRGFALKFYTSEGNWDLVGNNTPVFFVRDPMKFPDFIHTQKRHPKTNMRSPTAMWDFWSLSPESLHQVTILMSDRGLPISPMHINGYGSHTYSFWNDAGERFWVKFHFKTMQGHKHHTNAEAEDVVGMVRRVYQGRVRFHDGDAELAPGVSVHLIGGHTMGLQAVRVATRRGAVVLASDASHLYANMDEVRPFPIVWSVADMVEGYGRLRQLAESSAHIIPGHDPQVLERYPAPRPDLQGIVARLD